MKTKKLYFYKIVVSVHMITSYEKGKEDQPLEFAITVKAPGEEEARICVNTLLHMYHYNLISCEKK